ncbi:MAG: hypothetical protein HRU03_03310 [Nanoarchaeales archaeon]|nr:hypothetical protein [Nanoarchaeales archaeon]
MDLRTLTPDVSSKLSFFVIVFIMTIFGFVQDYIFRSKDLPSLGNLFLLFFTLFACLLYLNYRFKIYREFYIAEVSQITNTRKLVFFIFVALIFFASIPNLLIFYVGTVLGGFILVTVLILFTVILGAGIVKYKTLIQGLIDTKIGHYNTSEDEKIKSYILDHKYKLSKKQIIHDLLERKYNYDRSVMLVHLMCDPLPII